jgi:hypothetical protein
MRAAARRSDDDLTQAERRTLADEMACLKKQEIGQRNVAARDPRHTRPARPYWRVLMRYHATQPT